MDAIDLAAGLRELNGLSEEEYRDSLEQLLAEPADTANRRLLRVGRLLGVALKSLFAEPEDLKAPSRRCSAYRAWTLQRSAFDTPTAKATWQYRALEALRSDPAVIHAVGGEFPDLYSLADFAQTERGFFWYVAMSCRNYLCGDPEIRSRIESEVETARRAGLDLVNITPETIVASGAVAIGAALVTSIPVLGMMGAPVIAGLVVIIYRIGIDAFCRWAAENEHYHEDFPNADED